jgi:hypothetical protein
MDIKGIQTLVNTFYTSIDKKDLMNKAFEKLKLNDIYISFYIVVWSALN